MRDKNKIKDKRIWRRMAYEINILSNLINNIYFDKDYSDIIDKKVQNKLLTTCRRVEKLKSDCDDIYYDTFNIGAEDLFYVNWCCTEDAIRKVKEKLISSVSLTVRNKK